MQRSVRGEVISSTFDEPATRHVQVAETLLHYNRSRSSGLFGNRAQRSSCWRRPTRGAPAACPLQSTFPARLGGALWLRETPAPPTPTAKAATSGLSQAVGACGARLQNDNSPYGSQTGNSRGKVTGGRKRLLVPLGRYCCRWMDRRGVALISRFASSDVFENPALPKRPFAASEFVAREDSDFRPISDGPVRHAEEGCDLVHAERSIRQLLFLRQWLAIHKASPASYRNDRNRSRSHEGEKPPQRQGWSLCTETHPVSRVGRKRVAERASTMRQAS
jgi:hypothetical protein